jgi:prepilin-type N-terminal cleavage/methylation domain-containing protein
MRRRPGVTLVEVLVAIFIMGIGMLALLTLFPLGAVSMAQALRDDRVASSAAVADNLALAFDVRHDSLVLSLFTQGTTPGPSNPVYADPWGVVNSGSGNVGTSTGIVRTAIGSFRTAAGTDAAAAPRYCTLLDDITFIQGGTPDLSTSSVQRAGWYTWAYMLQQASTGSNEVINMSIVVYQKRPLQLAPSEFLYSVSPAATAGTNSVTLTWTSGQFQPPIRRNSWLLDASTLVTGQPHGDFYRVVNYTLTGANTIVVELEKNLKYNTDQMVVMQDVVEVFEKGPGLKP